MFQSLRLAWLYIKQKDALIWLTVFYFIINFAAACVIILVQPLILSFATALQLGQVLTAAAMGYVVGAVLMGIWGGGKIKRKIFLVYSSVLLMSLGLLLLPLSTNLWLLGTASFMLAIAIPISNACNQAIVQRKVHSHYIGRIDGFGNLLTSIGFPLGFLFAGQLADLYVEPFMATASDANAFFVQFYGVGQGRGIALTLSLVACVLLSMTIIAILMPKIRRIELDLPDED